MNDEEVLDKVQLMQDIVCVIDTGSSEEYIINDLLHYDKSDVKDCIEEMLKDNLLLDRGAYLVFNYHDERAKKIVYP